jgi:aminopeptidase N
LYEKGALILCELEQKTGKDQFLSFLKEVQKKKVASTAELLDLTGTELSDEIRMWLENKLRVE